MSAGAERLVAEVEAALGRRSEIACHFFARAFVRAMRRDFHAVRVSRAGLPPAPDTPRLIFYTNHPSWWDAAVFLVIAQRLFPGRRGYAPIDAAMLHRYPFMRRIGAFGVEQRSMREAAFFLAAGQRILAHADGLLGIAPQGRFADARERPTRLAPGLAHLAAYVPTANLVPLALDYCFWSERKPELLMRFGAIVSAATLLEQGVRARTRQLGTALEAAQDALAIEAIKRDEAAFETLVDGSAGVGGVYDLWRRARAAFRGERFSAAHEGGA